MHEKLLAFDIETACTATGAHWKRQRPLGITCIASMTSDCREPKLWFSLDEQQSPAPQMSQALVVQFVQYLEQQTEQGFVALSWNGLGFDLDILAEESGLRDACRRLARSHVDMMFHLVCELGFPVSLDKAAAGLGLAGKLAGVTARDAPRLWAAGEHDRVLDYVAQDVRTTLAIAIESQRRGAFAWQTGRGKTRTLPLKRGWLRVDEANRLPQPDTSWMSKPLRRSQFTGWL